MSLYQTYPLTYYVLTIVATVSGVLAFLLLQNLRGPDTAAALAETSALFNEFRIGFFSDIAMATGFMLIFLAGLYDYTPLLFGSMVLGIIYILGISYMIYNWERRFE